MPNIVKVDISAIERTEKDLHRGGVLILGRLGERGATHLREEVPYKTGNLKQGIQAPAVDEAAMRAEVVVTARSAARGPRPAVVHYPSGKTKQIMLRPQVGYNYAAVVDQGYDQPIVPKVGKALLIPVGSVDAGETYISDGTQLFVVRRRVPGGIKGDHFVERAAAKTSAEAPAVAGQVFSELFT